MVRVKIKNLSRGTAFEVDVKSGSLSELNFEADDGCAFYFSGDCWHDKWSNQGFRYEITELKPEPTPPTALMEIIGNIPAGDWSKISAIANEEIKNSFSGLPPVNKAQVIRCLYAFERYARENGTIKPEPPATDAEPFEYEAGITRVKSGGVEGVVESVDGSIAYVVFDKSDGIPELITTPVLIRKLTRI